MPSGKITQIESTASSEWYAVFYGGYIANLDAPERAQCNVGDTLTTVTDRRNRVIRVAVNGETIRALGSECEIDQFFAASN